MKKYSTQLNGLRALSIAAICFDHWKHDSCPRFFPFEVFLFFFLVMTGFFITESLLNERDRLEKSNFQLFCTAIINFQYRRALRIMIPYYLAFSIAIIVGIQDSHTAFWWYLFHLSNFHMAQLSFWPPGCNHFWSLAMQQQFYFVWPFIIWLTPRKYLLYAIILFTIIGPLSRYFSVFLSAFFVRPGVITFSCLDFFGIGALFAFAHNKGMPLMHPILLRTSLISLLCYIVLSAINHSNLPTYGLGAIQETFCAIFCCGIIAITSFGIKGWCGEILEHPVVQYLGKLSFSIFLFHNLAPLISGKILWFLWNDTWRESILFISLRAISYIIITIGLSVATWHWIELPIQNYRKKLNSAK